MSLNSSHYVTVPVSSSRCSSSSFLLFVLWVPAGFSLLDVVVPLQYQSISLWVLGSWSGQIHAAHLSTHPPHRRQVQCTEPGTRKKASSFFNSLCYDVMLLRVDIIFQNSSSGTGKKHIFYLFFFPVFFLPLFPCGSRVMLPLFKVERGLLGPNPMILWA